MMLTKQTAPAPDAPQVSGNHGRSAKLRKWFKRIGVAGFMFFLIKGLIWLAVFYFGASSLID